MLKVCLTKVYWVTSILTNVCIIEWTRLNFYWVSAQFNLVLFSLVLNFNFKLNFKFKFKLNLNFNFLGLVMRSKNQNFTKITWILAELGPINFFSLIFNSNLSDFLKFLNMLFVNLWFTYLKIYKNLLETTSTCIVL